MLKPKHVEEYRGRINFALNYDKDISSLFVHVLESMDLPVRDITGEWSTNFDILYFAQKELRSMTHFEIGF